LQFFSLVIAMLAYTVLFARYPCGEDAAHNDLKAGLKARDMWPNASGATRLRVGLHEGEDIGVIPVCQRKDLEHC
jgi:hypothetical protein